MDLYMAGSTYKELNNWIAESDYNKLFSQLNDRKEIAILVEYKRNNPNCKSKLFIDSGAFSAHTMGANLDVDEYIEYVNGIDDVVDLIAQVDKIPGEFKKPKTEQQLANAPRESWDNYLYMRPKLKSPDKLLPIFHQGEDFKWLKNMLEWKSSEGNHISYIGISPANDVSVNEKEFWIEEVFKVISKSSNPNVKTHAFGMTSLRLLQLYPFTSADSTAWLQTAVNGSIFTDHGAISVTNKETKNTVNNFVALYSEQQKVISNFVEKMGYEIEKLKLDYKEREKFNISYLAKWSSEYEYKGSKQVEMKGDFKMDEQEKETLEAKEMEEWRKCLGENSKYLKKLEGTGYKFTSEGLTGKKWEVDTPISNALITPIKKINIDTGKEIISLIELKAILENGEDLGSIIIPITKLESGNWLVNAKWGMKIRIDPKAKKDMQIDCIRILSKDMEEETKTVSESNIYGSERTSRKSYLAGIQDMLLQMFDIRYFNESFYIWGAGLYEEADELIEQTIVDIDRYITAGEINAIKHYLKIKTKVNQVHTDPNVINLKNGLFNLITRKLEEHSSKYFTTAQIPVNYNPNVKVHEGIEKFFDEITCNDTVMKKAIFQMIGYITQPSLWLRKAFIMYGKTAQNRQVNIAKINRGTYRNR